MASDGSVFVKIMEGQEGQNSIDWFNAAGKTTILYTLKLGEVVTTIPTIGMSIETVHQKKSGFLFLAVDNGGRCKIRPLLRHYYRGTDAVLYIVDSTDDERLDDALNELCQCLSEDELRDSVFMLLCNKQDKHNAMTAENIYEKLLEKEPYRARDIVVFPVSGINRETLMEPLKWLSEKLANRETWNAAKSSVTEIKDIVKPVANPVGYLKKDLVVFDKFVPRIFLNSPIE